MKVASPKQQLNQALILSKLLERPLRFKELWEEVRFQVRSKQQFVKNLEALEEIGTVERVKSSHKHVLYKFVPELHGREPLILSFARRIGTFGSVELLADCMELLVNSPIFGDQEEAVQAAIDFWVERYRNLCVLGALYSLPIFESEVEDQKEKAYENTLMLRKMYQTTEDKFFEVILRFSRKYPEIFGSVLERKLFLKGIELKPSWLGMKLSKFLKTYYPQAYEKLGETGAAKMYFELRKKEGEKEYFTCLKFKQELPQGICNMCKYRPIMHSCRYRKTPSTREKILLRRQKEWPKDLTH